MLDKTKPDELPLSAQLDDRAFDWTVDGPDAGLIICHRQPATAVYENVHGHIVVRQEAYWNDDSDTIATITPDNAGRLTDAIMAIARGQK
jgi:hypothetical protein